METSSLTNKRVIITRAEEQSGELVAKLRALGAEPLVCPTIAFAPPANTKPLDAALADLASFDWIIFTSANAVRFVWERMAALRIACAVCFDIKIGVVGPATAQALVERGIQPTLVATTACAEGLLAEIIDVNGMHILLPCADIARSELADGLRAKGAQTTVVTAYRTVSGNGVSEIIGHLREQRVDAIVFASPSAARYLLRGMNECNAPRALLQNVALVCIGPTTAAAVREAGFHAIVSHEPTSDGVVNALIQIQTV